MTHIYIFFIYIYIYIIYICINRYRYHSEFYDGDITYITTLYISPSPHGIQAISPEVLEEALPVPVPALPEVAELSSESEAPGDPVEWLKEIYG